ncbi:HAE1 family hydrophobic/amphiphilic exporter-1 [Tenggerimyces flavus]|nr:HAE1 family hydrophobic/amphiphilic exporter-1 [Tenggerimyces flavus]
MSIVIVGFGLLSTVSLKQELIPSLTLPGAFIATSYPGASPEIVERELTEPIESAITGVDGLSKTTSTSSNGFSMIQAEFTYGTDVARAVQDVQQNINRISGQLPEDVDPTVQAGSTDDFPVVLFAVTSDADEKVLAQRLKERVIPELEGIADVQEATVTGARDEQVTVTVDAKKLEARGLTLDAVTTALQANGVSIPGGNLDQGSRTLPVEVGKSFGSVADLRNVPIVPTSAPPAQQPEPQPSPQPTGEPGGDPGEEQAPPAPAPQEPAAPQATKLSDVATVKAALAQSTSITRTDGKESLGISVTKKTEGNTVTVANEVKDKVPDLEDALGDNAKLTLVFDQAPFIEESIEGLTTEGAIGLLFAVLVILVFLLSLRSTLVTAVSIPFSLLVAMIGLYVGGYSLNILTLGALTVAVGRVVDDSIVVLENIKRHIAYGEEKRAAILTAVKEVAGAVTASTVTTVGVFLPIAFVGGQTGELFRPFAVTVTIALLASLLVSLTVIPVLSYWFLGTKTAAAGNEAAVAEAAEAAERRSILQRAYVPVIRWVTKHRLVTIFVALVIFAGTIGGATFLKTNFLDQSGQNTLTVTQTMPVATSLGSTDAAAKKVEAVLTGFDGVESYQATVGSGGGFGGFGGGGGSNEATFSITTDEEADQADILDRLRTRLDQVTGAGEIAVESGASGFGPSGLEVIVQAPDATVLRNAAAQVERAMRDVDGTADVSNNLAADQPGVRVDVDRTKAAAVGLSDAQIGQAVRQAFEGQQSTTVLIDAAQRDVIVRGGAEPTTVAALRSLAIRTPLGTSVALSTVATVSESEQPAQLTRIDGERSASVTASVTASDVGKVSADLQTQLDDLSLPSGASYTLGGVSSEQSEAFGQLGLALLAAIAIVFLVMVATFRSIVQPLILLVSVPFAATGTLGLLLATNTALGVPALIGLLMLVGIVVTNAIVLIDLINQYREQGMSVREAVIEGGRRRLRPILMTATATIFALLPMSLGLTGGGVFISQPLAIVVIGGLISSTLLTLVLVPTLYTMIEGWKERRAERRNGHRLAPPAPEQEEGIAVQPAPLVDLPPVPRRRAENGNTPAPSPTPEPAHAAEPKPEPETQPQPTPVQVTVDGTTATRVGVLQVEVLVRTVPPEPPKSD